MPAARADGASTPHSGGATMKKRAIARLAFAGATAVALAFGAPQALAAPAGPESTCSGAACTDE